MSEANITETQNTQTGQNLLTREAASLLSTLDMQEVSKVDTAALIVRMQSFSELMMEYECALMEIETKLKVLNAEFSMQHNHNPLETIKSRIKDPVSIANKLKRKGLPISAEAIEANISDIAGIRVICSFPEDIYSVARLVEQQDDITIIAKKDYIRDPKPNGYRSLHLIVQVPIFLANQKVYKKVEIQFRTIAMDFWASLEHKLKYKKDVDNPQYIAAKLKNCAETIAVMDREMQEIKDLIEQELEEVDGKSSNSEL
ncbi:MAG: GTP pyrophosphokinase family protein [Lachnospiraceae bacterium]